MAATGGALDVDLIGVPELVLIAIGRAHDDDDTFPGADGLPGDLGVPGGDADAELYRRPHPQDLLDKDRNVLRVCAQPLLYLFVGSQDIRRVSDRVGRIAEARPKKNKHWRTSSLSSQSGRVDCMASSLEIRSRSGARRRASKVGPQSACSSACAPRSASSAAGSSPKPCM